MATDMLDDMDFEEKLNNLGDNEPELIRFIARQQYDTGKILVNHGRRIKSLESKNNRVMAIIGGAGALIATAIMSGLDYFLRRTS